MGFEIRGVDHYGLLLAVISRQTNHHFSEDALVAPPLPTVIQRLVWPILPWRVTPPQPIAINEDNPTEDAFVINTRFAVGLGKERFQTRHLRIAQPE